ncbi:hypothetical protein I4641_19670 [Waterburya agarophytonicola K14]|uniref:Uncharacterized protein n=1 Tax=Waterburya agarophytonicola KI4 TaxID=2874699 RepID=A0A964FL64_9CYAN|nr:hypothetical protein [Waterburya agarophytonicola]MCC0179188.1 hypothetical protein [Waterburya agarophytonicola KI4]
MTSSNGNNSDRLDRIEAIVESLARSAQAITNDHEERIQTLEDVVSRLTRIEEGQNAMLGSIDENQPTILRRLMAIENKVDTLIERDR